MAVGELRHGTGGLGGSALAPSESALAFSSAFAILRRRAILAGDGTYQREGRSHRESES
jgi:hypothetical protein